jgi:hypothetical protein
MGAMLVVVTTSITRTSITKMELEENIRRKELTPAELSKEMVRKAVQVAPAISTASVEKKPQGRKRTYAAPKADVAQAIGVSTGTLVNAGQHVAAMERYPVLGGPEVSQKQALELVRVLDGLPAGEELWPNARRNPLGSPPPKDAKDHGCGLSFQAFMGCSHCDLLHLLGEVIAGKRRMSVKEIGSSSFLVNTR